MDIPYSPKEVVAKLNIGESTIRKWCPALEKHNYNFTRTDQNKRLFTEKDVIVLSQMKVLIQDKNMSINNAAAVVASQYVKEVFSNETEVEQGLQPLFSNGTEVEQAMFFNESLEEQKAEIEQLKAMNTTILELLEEQKKGNDEMKKYISERLDKHDELLMQSLRASQEVKKVQLQIAAAQEEEKNKPWYRKIFGK